MSLNQILKGTLVPLPLEGLSIQLTLGAQEGYVLTSDGAGNGVWMPAGSGANLAYVGVWSPTVTYSVQQVVYYNGSSYVSTSNNNLNNNPLANPGMLWNGDTEVNITAGPIELGSNFTLPAQGGQITAIAYYQLSSMTGNIDLNLWRVSDQSNLYTTSVATTGTTGWIITAIPPIVFSSAVPLCVSYGLSSAELFGESFSAPTPTSNLTYNSASYTNTPNTFPNTPYSHYFLADVVFIPTGEWGLIALGAGGGGGGVQSVSAGAAPAGIVIGGTSTNPTVTANGVFGTRSVFCNNVTATGGLSAASAAFTVNSDSGTINSTGDVNAGNANFTGNLLVSTGGGFGSYTSLDNGAITTDGFGTLSGTAFEASASVTAEGGGVATNSVSSPAGGGVGNLVAQSLITTGALVTSTGLQTTGVAATGIWGTNQPCNVSFYKLGNTVTMSLSAVLALANNAATINLGSLALGVLASPFPPPNLAWALSTTAYTNDRQLNYPILITDNNTDFTGECILVFDGLGNVAISVTGAYGGNFSGLSTSGSSGFYNSTFSWLTDA